MFNHKLRTVFRNGFFWIAIFALQVTGCSNEESQSSHSDEVTYVCLETHKIVVLPKTETPAVNPETGRRTLVEAKFCADCNKWYPTPQTGGVGGQPARCVCPVHGHPLVANRDSE